MDSPEITRSLLGMFEEYGHLTVRNMKIFLRWAGIESWSKDSCVLDLGCANGLFLMELKARGFTNVIGVDNSKEMVIRAKQNSEATVFLGNADEVDAVVPASSVDVIIVSNIIHHLESKEAWDKMLHGCYLTLKPSGLLIIREPYNTVINWAVRALSKFSIFHIGFLKPIMEDCQAEWDLHNYFYKHWYPEETQRLNRCGFNIMTTRDWLFHRLYKCEKVSP